MPYESRCYLNALWVLFGCNNIVVEDSFCKTISLLSWHNRFDSSLTLNNCYITTSMIIVSDTLTYFTIPRWIYDDSEVILETQTGTFLLNKTMFIFHTPYLLESAPMLERAPPQISAPFCKKKILWAPPSNERPLFPQNGRSFETYILLRGRSFGKRLKNVNSLLV